MSRDPLGTWGDPAQRGNAQNYCGNNPVNFIDPLGLSPISTVVKAMAKAGTKKAAKAAAKKFLKEKLGELATKKGAKKLLGEVDDIVDTLDNEWWEWPIEIFEFCVPGWGDAVAAGRYGAKLKAMHDRMEALERRTEKFIRSKARKAKKAKKAKKAEGKGKGVIYVRTDQTPGAKHPEYVGQAKSEKRYERRQGEHRRDHPDKDLKFDKLEDGVPDDQLDKLEEDWIRAGGGPKKRGGTLDNDGYPMTRERYDAAGGEIPRPTD